MALVVYRSRRFEKCLELMRRAGGAGALAAARAEEIIRRLTRAAGGKPMAKGKLTRKGEARIGDCVKFDLGGGYRLIGRREGGRFALVFVGDHDGCDRWICNNRGHGAGTGGVPRLLSDAPRERETETERTLPPVPDRKEYPETPVGQRELRLIFKGLCRRQ